MNNKIAWYMIGAGVAMNVIDTLTSKDTSGGAIFGTNGILKAVNEAIPDTDIGGFKVNVAGWVAIAGAAYLAYTKFAK
jgi:hypothetical protein